MSLGEFLVQKTKGKLICNSSNDIISANFDSEKVGQDGIFYYKHILHFFFEWPKYYTYQKSYQWLVPQFMFKQYLPLLKTCRLNERFQQAHLPQDHSTETRNT
jgi:hypothetical protein